MPHAQLHEHRTRSDSALHHLSLHPCLPSAIVQLALQLTLQQPALRDGSSTCATQKPLLFSSLQCSLAQPFPISLEGRGEESHHCRHVVNCKRHVQSSDSMTLGCSLRHHTRETPGGAPPGRRCRGRTWRAPPVSRQVAEDQALPRLLFSPLFCEQNPSFDVTSLPLPLDQTYKELRWRCVRTRCWTRAQNVRSQEDDQAQSGRTLKTWPQGVSMARHGSVHKSPFPRGSI